MSQTPPTNADNMDLDRLLEASRPRRQHSLMMPMLLMGIMVASLASLRGDNPLLQAVVPAVFAGAIIVAVVHATRITRRQQRERESLRRTDEAIRLGRWDEAAATIHEVLSRPVMLPQSRVQGLIYLGAVLAWQGQFEQTIRLYEHLLASTEFPPPIAMSLRCLRIYAILREERLSDAYDAIAQLKRETPGGSAMLSLLEIYRLVKTGHNDDALQLFGQKQVQLAAQLGHRSCDGWALAAVAAAALGREQEAAAYGNNAAVLGDVREIGRRFPEWGALVNRIGAAGIKVQAS